MDRQNAESEEKVPKILTFLIDIIVKLEGQKSEGIFRVPGDAEGVSGNLQLI